MSDQIKQIAIRIKELREICEYSPEEVAKSANITPEHYLQYESGESDIPVSVLYALAGLYKVELTSLLTGGDPHLHMYTVVRKGEGVEIQRRAEYKYKSLAYKFIGKKMEPLYVTAPIEGNPDDVIDTSSHEGQEFEYILEGKMKLIIAGNEIILNQGDCIYFNSKLPHGMRSIGDKEAVFLAIIL